MEVGKRPQHPPPSFPCPSCPRCSSHNTKFCYYNNYSVSQPRYFCKDCRRYWTHGGAVRNIPTRPKRPSRTDIASSSSQSSKPQLSGGPPIPSPLPTWSALGFSNHPVGGGASLSIGRGTFMPPIRESIQSYNGVGGGFNRASFMFNQGGVDTAAFGAVTIPQPAPSTPMFPHLSPLDFGSPFLQRPQNHPPPPVTWTGQNLTTNNGYNTLNHPNSFVTIARNPTEAANVVNINEWSELNDMDVEAGLIQSYKPPSP